MEQKDQKTEIAEKIKKLMALSESSNVNEAALAAERARSLLEKYGMTLTDVEIQTAEMIMEKFHLKHGGKYKHVDRKTILPWIASISRIMQDFFYIRVVYSNGGQINFLGEKTDVQIATYVFKYLCAEIERLSDKECEDYGTLYEMDYGYKPSMQDFRSHRASFNGGAAQGIREKLENEKSAHVQATTSTGTDLMVIKGAVAKQYTVLIFPHLTQSKIRTSLSYHSDAASRGYAVGKNIQIRRGIDNKDGGQRRLS